jgi:hypothetical protein
MSIVVKVREVESRDCLGEPLDNSSSRTSSDDSNDRDDTVGGTASLTR